MLEQLIKLRRHHWWVSIWFWMAAIAPASAAPELRVAISDGVRQVKIGSSTPAVVRDNTGRVLGELSAMNGMDAQPKVGGVALGGWQAKQIWIEPTGSGYVWIGSRWYRGRTQIVPTSKGLTAVNHVDLEQYLYSVLGAEMNGNWPAEALKAQAVAARSYALYKRQTARKSVYDLGDTVTWQVYKGIDSETPTTQKAVNSTAGQVMTYNGKVILAVFHAASGGHTENVEDIWSQPLPYLRGVPDYDQGTPTYQWTKTFSREEISQRLGVSNVRSLIPERTSTYGRILKIKVVGESHSRQISGRSLSQALKLKSTRFTITSTPTGFQINGTGFGHGLGLSQWGAYNLANQGVNYQQILGHYYRGISLAYIPADNSI